MKNNKIVILFFVFNFLWLHAQKSEDNQVNKLLDSAQSLRASSKYIDAIQVHKSALLQLNTQSSSTATIAKIYSNIGDDFIKVRNLDSASVYINKGLRFLKDKKVDNSREKGLLYYSLGTVHGIKGDLVNGEKYFNEALKAQLESVGENHFETAATYGNLANIALYRRELNKAHDYLNTAIKITKNTLGENHQKVSGYYNNIGIVYSLKGELKRALINYENSVRITKNNYGSDFIKLNQPYYNLSSLYHQLGDYDKAIDYMRKSIRLKEKVYNVRGYELGAAYSSLAIQYSEINKFEEAITSLEKGLKILKKTYGEIHDAVGANYTNFSTTYRKMNKNHEAIEYGLKALDVFDKLPNKDYTKILSVYSNISKAYINLGDYTNAVEYSEKALAVFAIKKVTNKADTYLNLAKVNILKNENNFNEKYLDSATSNIGYDRFNPEEFNNVNDLDALSYFFELKLLKYKNKLQLSKNDAYSDSLRITYNTFLRFQDFIYQKFSRRESKSFRIDQSHFLYENSILNIVDRKKDEELVVAFEEAEKVKSRLLQENLNKQNAQEFANIKDSLLIKEYDLEKKLSQLEKKKFSLKDSDSLLSSIKNEIFEIKNKQDILQETIKTQHPDYYNLVYNQKVINVKEVQKLLSDNESLVEYFVGKQHIFIFLITKDTYVIKQVEKDFPLKKWIEQLRNGIYNYWAMPDTSSDEDLKKYNQLYKDMAFKLYQKLVQPIENEITHKVIIIPDGELHFIPFDALLTADSKQISATKKLPYLVKKHQISYNYSATLYNQLKQKESSNSTNDVLAFAPKFTNDENVETIAMRRNGLGNLKYNTIEVDAINNLFNTNVFKDSSATKTNFIANAKNHKIIHLSTHAKSNDTYGDFSFIAFSKNDSLQKDKLYVRELYNLDLDADMVVLSACETGIGELKKGEGVISLARAFTYAGARSTITSLWNVNDAQTTKLMTLFYTNLKEGMPKDEALRTAKLTYIENEDLTSPYFWAAFTPTGDMKAIEMNSNNNIKYIGIGALLLALIFGLRFFLKKRAA